MHARDIPTPARDAYPTASVSPTWAMPAALSVGQIATYATALVQGGPGADFKRLTPQDAGAIFGAAMRMLVTRHDAAMEVEAADAGIRYDRPTRASLSFGPGQPSEIMRELLGSVEARNYLRILAACVGAAARLCFQVPHVPPVSTWSRESAQDRALCGLVRRKLGLVTVMGEATLATVEPSLRAWVNSLSRREAEHWATLAHVKRHYVDIQDAGREIRATWGQALAQVGVRLEALDTSKRFLALPVYDPADYVPQMPEGNASRATPQPSPKLKLQPEHQ